MFFLLHEFEVKITALEIKLTNPSTSQKYLSCHLQININKEGKIIKAWCQLLENIFPRQKMQSDKCN